MTLKELCEQAAVYTDRRDDFLTITRDGREMYDPEDDPGIWFESMKGSVNQAYREAARALLMPDRRVLTELGEGGSMDLLALSPGCQQVRAVWSADETNALAYDFVTKFEIRVRGGKQGDKVTLQYHFVPDALESLTDEPMFPESLVDPMLYISLAAADIWAMERKTQISQYWLSKYYQILSGIRRDMKGSQKRRIRRALFR